jgi:predicted NBD/HSP70 family sugar kinase
MIGSKTLVAEARTAHRGSPAESPLNLRSLIEKAHAQDAVCLRVLQDAGRTLGFALAQLCNLLNPGLIVLGGELALGKNLVLEPCEQELKRYSLSGAVNPEGGFALRTSELPYAEAQGALILGLRACQLEGTPSD